MANKRIKDISTASTSFASDDFVITDSATSGTRKMTKDNLISQVSAGVSGDYLEESNNLSDVASAAASRTNLEVNSIAQDAESTGTKLVSPSLSFDGSNDFLEIADSSKLSFTDETDDLPFSVGAWVKMEDATSFPVISKFGTSAALSEWVLDTHTDDKLRLRLQSTSSILNDAIAKTDVALTAYEGKWVHIAATYSAESAFGSAQDDIVLYVNGQAVAITASTDGDYEGMSDTSQPVQIGKSGGSLYANGFIKEVKLFNRELSASEVVDSMNGDLGFADEWGGANGGIYSSDFSSTTHSWTNSNTTLSQASGPLGGRSNFLQITTNAGSATHSGKRITNAVIGKRYRVRFDYYIPSGNSNVDGLKARFDNGVYSALQNTLDAWTPVTFEAVATSSALEIYQFDGAAQVFDDTGGDDNTWIDNVTVTEIGTLADLRASRYDDSTGKIYDISDNGFIGTSANLPTLVGREIPVYETGSWTPTITFGGGSTGMTYTSQEGYYTRVGNVVHLQGEVTISAVGSSAGTARIEGFPFSSFDVTTSGCAFSVTAFSMTGLTSPITALVEDNQPSAVLYDSGATGSAAIADTNFTATSSLRFAGTYQIQ